MSVLMKLLRFLLSMGQILNLLAGTVDLLKIDIEGAEDELLSVDNQWLKGI